MKIEKISKRIEEIDKNAIDTVKETNQQIENLNKELESISAQIEETYRSGDIVKGQNLAEQKAVIESKISFLNTFLKKRKDVPLMENDEAKKLRTDLNNELYNVFHEQKRKADSYMKGLLEIHDVLEKAIQDTVKTGNNIIRLSKTKELSYSIDQCILSLNNHLRNFTATYKNYQDYFNKMK